SFEGRIGRVPYLLASAAAFFSQHLLVIAICWLLKKPPVIDTTFWIAPLRALVTHAYAAYGSNLFLIIRFAYFLFVAWFFAALAFRRAADADFSEAITAAAAAPTIQIPVILWLTVLPPRERDATGPHPTGPDYSAAAFGVVAGTGLTLLAVAVSTL